LLAQSLQQPPDLLLGRVRPLGQDLLLQRADGSAGAREVQHSPDHRRRPQRDGLICFGLPVGVEVREVEPPAGDERHRVGEEAQVRDDLGA
jgi:hypothetical protein